VLFVIDGVKYRIGSKPKSTPNSLPIKSHQKALPIVSIFVFDQTKSRFFLSFITIESIQYLLEHKFNTVDATI
jgi:hypothetical protein